MDGDYITQPISQVITGLTAGDTYVLSFNYAFAQQQGFYGDTQQNLTVSFGNTWSDVTPTITLPSQGFSGWMTYSGDDHRGRRTSDTLSFLAYGSLPVPPFALVSDVSLTGGVPEPATWAMMALGFAGLGFAGFRSNRRKAAAIA